MEGDFEVVGFEGYTIDHREKDLTVTWELTSKESNYDGAITNLALQELTR
jgi:hypothetical protein